VQVTRAARPIYNNKNLLAGDFEYRQLARQVGAFARFIVFIRLRMASHRVSWTLGIHARLRSPNFLFAAEEGLARAPTPVQPLRSTGLNVVIKALVKLRALESRAPGATSFSTPTTRVCTTRPAGREALSPACLTLDAPTNISVWAARHHRDRRSPWGTTRASAPPPWERPHDITEMSRPSTRELEAIGSQLFTDAPDVKQIRCFYL
jgi:hypothetical protein